jgi:hypothetical protein
MGEFPIGGAVKEDLGSLFTMRSMMFVKNRPTTWHSNVFVDACVRITQ